MSDRVPDLDWIESGHYPGGKGITPNGVKRIYGALCTLALGPASTAARRRKLAEWRTTLGVKPDDAELLETLGRGAQAMKLGLREAEQDLLLRALIDVATAGGARPSSRDQEILVRVANRFGRDRIEVEAMISVALERPPERKRPGATPTRRVDPLGLSGDDSDLQLLSRQTDLRLREPARPAARDDDLEVLPEEDEADMGGFELLPDGEDSDEEAATRAMLAEQLGDSGVGLI